MKDRESEDRAGGRRGKDKRKEEKSREDSDPMVAVGGGLTEQNYNQLRKSDNENIYLFFSVNEKEPKEDKTFHKSSH